MSDDDWDSDDWVDSMVDEMNKNAQRSTLPPRKYAKMPKRERGDKRTLIFCTDKSPERVLNALEDPDLHNKVGTLRQLVRFLVSGLTNAGWAVWQALKPYHVNLLAYHLAAGIEDNTIKAPTDVEMVRGAYDIIVHTLERFTNNDSDKPTYTQWVAKQTSEGFKNIDIVFRFLRQHDRQIARVGGPGKLP